MAYLCSDRSGEYIAVEKTDNYEERIKSEYAL